MSDHQLNGASIALIACASCQDTPEGYEMALGVERLPKYAPGARGFHLSNPSIEEHHHDFYLQIDCEDCDGAALKVAPTRCKCGKRRSVAFVPCDGGPHRPINDVIFPVRCSGHLRSTCECRRKEYTAAIMLRALD